MKKVSVTVGIPAYNEEGNIENLLNSLLSQRKTRYLLNEIVVYSDGSTDRTVERVRKMQKKAAKIRLVEGRKRRGKFYRVNQMFRNCDSELLVILDADIGLVGKGFIDSLVKVFKTDEGAMMVAADQKLLRPKNFVGRMIYGSYFLWDQIRLSVPKQDHVQNFYGAATAFRSSFAKKIQIPERISEERLYLYLTARRVEGFRYCREAKIVYWPVTTFGDFGKLARRSFGAGGEEINKEFGFQAGRYYKIGWRYKLGGVAKAFYYEPVYTFLGLWLSLFMSKLRPVKRIRFSPIWEITESSKKPFGNMGMKDKPKIIISSYDDLKNPYYGGGGAQAVHEVAKRLVEDFEVEVVTGRYPGSKDEVIDGVSYRRAGTGILGVKLSQVVFQMCLWRLAMLGRYEVWIESFTPPFSTAFLPLITKKPVIGLAHMLSAEDMKRKYKLPFDWVERWGLKRYKWIICPSEVYAKKIKEINRSVDVEVIANGIDLSLTKGIRTRKKKYISFIGRIEINQKGLDLLLRAYKRVAKNVPWRLQIAGGGEAREVKKLLAMIRRDGLCDKVIYRGRVSGSKKGKFFAETAVVALSSRYETFSLAALETMAFGIPHVCFEIDGLKWLPAGCGVKVKDFDVEAFGEGLKKLANDDKLRSEFGREARQAARKYSWEAAAEDYKKYIGKIIRNA